MIHWTRNIERRNSKREIYNNCLNFIKLQLIILNTLDRVIELVLKILENRDSKLCIRITNKSKRKK